MKKIIFISLLSALILSATACGRGPIAPQTIEETSVTATEKQEQPEETNEEVSPEIPPVARYNFNMSKENIYETLGIPDEESTSDFYDYISYGTWYNSEYSGISGHITFHFKNNKITRMNWMSPEMSMTPEYNSAVQSIVAYYDAIYGENEYQEAELIDGKFGRNYSWNDDYNNCFVEFTSVENESDSWLLLSISRPEQIDLHPFTDVEIAD